MQARHGGGVLAHALHASVAAGAGASRRRPATVPHEGLGFRSSFPSPLQRQRNACGARPSSAPRGGAAPGAPVLALGLTPALAPSSPTAVTELLGRSGCAAVPTPAGSL